MSPPSPLKARLRQHYPYILPYRTRWNDNDMYDHVNNAVYNLFFDSVVNTYLISQCSLHPPTSLQYPLAVHSHVDFFSSISYPSVAELCLRVSRLGTTSVTYEIALFEEGVEEVKAVGEFVHVFVERSTGRPPSNGMSADMRRGLERIHVNLDEGESSGSGSKL